MHRPCSSPIQRAWLGGFWCILRVVLIQNIFKNKLCIHEQLLSIPSFSQPLATTDLFSVFLDLPI